MGGRGGLFFDADDEDGDGGFVADLGDGAAVKDVAEPAVAMAGHGDEVAFFGGGDFEDFGGGIAEGEDGGDGEALVAEVGGDVFEVLAVVFHFLGFGEFKLVEVAGGPAIGDVEEPEVGAEAAGEFGDVGEDGLIGGAIFEGDEDFFIHGWWAVGGWISGR